jgi:ABC-type spermidine/putrescine transport system permease subunit I
MRFSPRSVAPWLWLLPALVLLVPFFMLPTGVLLRNSFGRDSPAGGVVADWTLRNYLAIATDSYYVQVFGNTVGIAAAIGIVALLIGYPFAWFLVLWAGRWRGLLLWAVYTPLLVSVVVRVFGWMAITADHGLINNFLLGVGLVDSPVKLLYEVAGMSIGMLHRYLPLMILPLVNALDKIEPSLLTASSGLGAGGMRTFWRVILPLSLPGSVAGFQLVFASVLSDYVLPHLMGTTRFRLLAPVLFDEAVSNLAWATAAAIGTTMVAMVVVLMLISNLALQRLAPWARSV